MRETSLDDFLGGSDDGERETTTGEDDGSSHGEDGSDGTSEPNGGETTAEGPFEPATATYAWTSGGAPCGDCEATVERRWRDEGRLVCADCKNW